MFEFVRKHTRLFQFILLILIVPSFVLVGAYEGYSRFTDGSTSEVARVDGQKITQADWDLALREQTERMRVQMPNIDPKLFDSPEMRQGVLDNLLRERVLQAAVTSEHRYISNEQLAEMVRTDPQFSSLWGPDGKFNKAVLAAQGMTVDSFFERLRQDVLRNQVLAPLAGSALATRATTDIAFDAFLQQRDVQFQRFDAREFAGSLKPTDADLETFFKDPKVAAGFQLPESADIEYVVLDQAALAGDATVNPDDVRVFYEQNKDKRFTTAQDRRASHILIAAPEDAAADVKAKAKARAEELLAQIRKSPGEFAALARANSQDSGSAPNGGDLGFFGRDSAIKQIEDAAFALQKVGEISNVVQSPFGYHIVQLTGIRGGEVQSLDAVRAQIEQELRRDVAQKRYAEVAEEFGNIVYEQSDSLKPAADKFKLTIQKATVQRKPAPEATGPLASTKLLEAVFSGDSLNNKRNTEAIDVGNSQRVAARVVQHHVARAPALADVKPAVTMAWLQQHAAEAARKAGEQRLAELQKGGNDQPLGPTQTVSRAKPGTLPPKALEAVLRADASKLPAHVGVDTGDGGYLVARITKIAPRDPAVVDPKRASEQYAQAWAAAEMQSYYGALKTAHEASIKPSALKAASAPAAN